MLNKEEIIKILETIDLPKDKFIIVSGASMVLQDIKKETSDIDLSISQELESKLTNLKYHLGYNNDKVYEMENIELFTTYYEKIDYTIINGYKVATPEYTLKLKRQLNRKKDEKDIKQLDLYLCLKDNYRYERELINQGIALICGVDEVGRGPLVGPVVAASVILPLNYELEGLTDSKKISEKKRNELYEIIMRDAIAVSIGIKDNEVIDKVNIYEATKLAMYEAIEGLTVKPEYVLIDAMKLENLNIPYKSIIKGDAKSKSIAAASIIAKVTRDNMMYELDKEFPEYGFAKHKGYPTKAHIEAINKYGLLDNYRFTFGPVHDLILKGERSERKIRKTNIKK